ncbi:MAG: LpxL/LpxP family Kdo(2)-lipid IV(A) lauroyl/palmitoleoyl acyltransferase [Saccharospirillum sp.]|nr:LpxL/LpxP family Kdo(2)-lipid IV(A) lauroyl/palmitoleoyl acyltransferase [Saccharospirillum sp.]
MRQAKAESSSASRQRNSRVTDQYRYRDFLAPRYWGAWLFIGFMQALGRLPARARIVVARGLTPLLLKVARSRRRVAERNIALCFPELSQAERDERVRNTFFASVLGFLETALAWCGPVSPILDRIEIEGLENLAAAKAQGKGVLMVGGHFAMLDLAGALFGLIEDYDLVYRKHDNLLLNYFMTRSREKYCKGTLARKDMRGLIRSLKSGNIVWYAPDQDFGRKASVFVPFFGIPAATVTMTSKLAKVSGAVVLPVVFWREPSHQHYGARFGKPLPIPSDDEVADAAAFNAWLEGEVRAHPDQYLWLHKRFKTRPEGEPSVY